MRKTLTLTTLIAAFVLAGCAQHSAPLALHAPPHAPHQAAASHIPQRTHRAHLTRLGCVYLRERLGLTLSSAPPLEARGIPAQPDAQGPRRMSAVQKYLAAHTNCVRAPQRSASRRPATAVSPPRPRPGPGWPVVSAYYPAAAQRLGVEGEAAVRVCIGPHGHVTSTSISRSSGSPQLDRAALEYAHATSGHWRPARAGGRRVSSCTLLTVRFSMLGF